MTDTSIEVMANAATIAAQAAKDAALNATIAAKAASDMAISNEGMKKDIGYIKDSVSEIKETLKTQANSFVGLDDWKQHLKRDEDHETRIRLLEKEEDNNALARKIVYGACSFIGLAVLGAIIYLVIKH